MYKTTPNVIFVLEFGIHFGGGKTTGFSMVAVPWITPERKKDPKHKLAKQGKQPQENSERNTRAE